MTTRRKPNTGNAADFVIPLDQDFNMGWACRLDTAYLTGIHEKEGATILMIPSDGSTVASAAWISASLTAVVMTVVLF
jgi:hypothetical protein